MAIAVYVNPEGMTTDQYNEARSRLTAAGAGSPKGRLHHSAFGPPDNVMVYDVWESGADYEAFGETLRPILEEVGIKMTNPPDIMPVHDIVQ
jgi:hypothetical protein